MAKTLDEAGVKRLIQEIKGANKNLNAPIPISTENTPESMAQNVKNIADYVEKAKAAGIADVNGMAVTCLIDGGGYSGVGYLNGDTDTSICAIEIFDDSSNPMYFKVNPDGTYGEVQIIMENSVNIVTSDMLVKGARNPIVITGDMTEVDEETYQKLLSGDVDVIANFGEGIFIEPQAKFNTGDTLNLIFGYSQFDESNDGAIATYTISINTSAPHTLTLAAIGSCEPVSKFILSPVLQEIDLTGTDAERKAKLDQFAVDWKTLTGASDLSGARFVGGMGTPNGALSTIFALNSTSSFYEGVGTDDVGKIYKIQVDPSDGSITITPLFSHLEAITIKTNNATASKVANVAAIKAYVDNLTALGVDTTKGYMIPVKLDNGYHGFIMGTGADGNHTGVIKRDKYNDGGGWIFIDNIGTYQYLECLTLGDYDNLTTTAKTIVPAINEVNALAKGYSTIFTPIELTTETAQNKTAIDARVAAFTAQGISLTNGCCIPVTYKGVYAGNISLINGDWYGLLVKNTNNPADNINIKLSADGTIAEGNSAQ